MVPSREKEAGPTQDQAQDESLCFRLHKEQVANSVTVVAWGILLRIGSEDVPS
jgi:hypothetical protein